MFLRHKNSIACAIYPLDKNPKTKTRGTKITVAVTFNLYISCNNKNLQTHLATREMKSLMMYWHYTPLKGWERGEKRDRCIHVIIV
jgi:hypothetical protein